MTAAPIRVYKRNDIRHRIFKVRNLALKAMREAEAAGDEDWRHTQLTKLRMAESLLIEIDAKCPVYAAQGIQAGTGETAKAARPRSGESPVSERDAPAPCGKGGIHDPHP